MNEILMNLGIEKNMNFDLLGLSCKNKKALTLNKSFLKYEDDITWPDKRY